MIFVHLHIVNSHRCTGAQNLILFFPNNVQAASLNVVTGKLPVTTYCRTENKLAEISSSLRQSELIQKDYSQSKLIIKSADLTEDGYPRTLTSSRPSDNVSRSHKTSSRNHMKLITTRKRWRNRKGKPQAPTTTWRCWKYLKSANHQTIQQAIAN